MKKIQIATVKYGKSAQEQWQSWLYLCKQWNMNKVQQEKITAQKSATRKWCSLKKVQQEKRATLKSAISKNVIATVKYGKIAQEQCTIVDKQKAHRPLTDRYTLVTFPDPDKRKSNK